MPHIFLYYGNWYVKERRDMPVMILPAKPGTHGFEWACKLAKEVALTNRKDQT